MLLLPVEAAVVLQGNVVIDLDQLLAELVVLVGNSGFGSGVQHDAQSILVQLLFHRFIIGTHEGQILRQFTVNEQDLLFGEAQLQDPLHALGGTHAVPVGPHMAKQHDPVIFPDLVENLFFDFVIHVILQS